jgi:hypothetical protein
VLAPNPPKSSLRQYYQEDIPYEKYIARVLNNEANSIPAGASGYSHMTRSFLYGIGCLLTGLQGDMETRTCD